MLADIADASRTVGPEQESEYLPDEIGIYLTVIHIFGAFSASVESTALDTRPDLTPSRLLILMATGAFVRQILTARATVEATRRYEFFVCFYFLHISNAPQSDDAGYYNTEARTATPSLN